MGVRTTISVGALACALALPGVSTAATTATTGGARFGDAPVKKATPKRAVPKVSRQAVGGAAPVAAPPVGGPPPVTTAPSVPGSVGVLNPDGTASPPADAPPEVQALFAAANRIATLPYRYGGGHQSFDDTAYDCSGSVSYALHGAGLLDTTLASGGLESWGRSGPGSWITVYANADHTFLIVAGLRFDTSGQKAAGTRWQPAARSLDGFVVRHPPHL